MKFIDLQNVKTFSLASYIYITVTPHYSCRTQGIEAPNSSQSGANDG